MPTFRAMQVARSVVRGSCRGAKAGVRIDEPKQVFYIRPPMEAFADQQASFVLFVQEDPERDVVPVCVRPRISSGSLGGLLDSRGWHTLPMSRPGWGLLGADQRIHPERQEDEQGPGIWIGAGTGEDSAEALPEHPVGQVEDDAQGEERSRVPVHRDRHSDRRRDAGQDDRDGQTVAASCGRHAVLKDAEPACT
jgi:hypothetical protein